MQRADGRPGKAHGLAAQVRVLRPGLLQPAADTLPHFPRRRPGEGDDKHPVDTLALPQQGKHPLHQHRRFARARRRADQHAVVARLDGRLLSRRPLHENRPRPFRGAARVLSFYFTASRRIFQSTPPGEKKRRKIPGFFVFRHQKIYYIISIRRLSRCA